MSSNNDRRGVGLACFVKTPGLSPIKTRLAATIGKPDAETLYTFSVAAIQGILKGAENEFPELACYWAVAEPKGVDDLLWSTLPTLVQQGTTLGAKLHSIYSALMERHEAAIVIGSDSPQLTMESIASAFAALSMGKSYVMGPATDGGFYLFGGVKPVDEKIWSSIEYSTQTTGNDLIKALDAKNDIGILDAISDVDEYPDLKVLFTDLGKLKDRSTPQEQLLRWLRSHPQWCD